MDIRMVMITMLLPLSLKCIDAVLLVATQKKNHRNKKGGK